MAPAITIITGIDTKLINAVCINILQKYYPIFADGHSIEYHIFLEKYKNSNSRYFIYDNEKWLMFSIDELKCLPHFVINFDQGKVMSDAEWEFIQKWVNAIFQDDDDLTDEMYEMFPQYSKIDSKSNSEDFVNVENDAYAFRYFIDEESDKAYFEVTKPYTDRPYTSVIRSYSVRGMLPFFTSLYVCSSWGICNHDHMFLNRVWNHLNMNVKHGELDLERRLKEDIAKCLPDNPGGPESEPEVYRCSIENLLERVGNKRQNEDFVDTSENIKKIKTLF